MDFEQAKLRLAQLTKEIEQHNYAYYVLDAPTIEDCDYDALMRELKAIETEYPQLLSPHSPSQRVGGMALSDFQKVTHTVLL